MRPIEDIQLVRPATLTDAALLLAEEGSRLVAGGTDLLPNMRRGIADPAVLIDLTGVAGIAAIEPHHGQWRLGAGVTLATIERHAQIASELPALAQAAGAVAGPAHRSAATLAGNLCQDTRCVYYNQSEWWRRSNGWCLKLKGDTCHVAPHGKRCHAAYQGDVAAALLAYGAEVEIVGAETVYRRPLAELYRDDGAAHLTLGANEVVAAVHVPAGHAGRVSGFRKARTRSGMDFPLASVAVALRMEGGVLAELSVGISGTNSHPLKLDGTYALLGRPVDEAALATLGKLVAKQVTPMRSTITASNHRRLVASATAQRLLRALAAGAA
ncbi:MAG: 4-hydroxybenzoyl-CoA reductase subunit beta [Burkholderiaceae bacterium]|nr:4-hydroxybenzoyl-CoA reductase subunit beta [Burkholderiaceae bacterium]